MSPSQAGLSACGAQEGQLLRVVLGDEIGLALQGVLAVADRVCRPMMCVPLPQLLQLAAAWGTLQRAASPAQPVGPVCALPPHCERWLLFAGVPYGAGISCGLLHRPTLPRVVSHVHYHMSTGPPVDPAGAALECAGIEGAVEVLLYVQQPEGLFGVPSYTVAVDYETGCASPCASPYAIPVEAQPIPTQTVPVVSRYRHDSSFHCHGPQGQLLRPNGAHRALCGRCVKSRLFSTP